MKKGFQLLFLVIITCIMTSCMTTKTKVGTYQEESGEVYKYSKGKQVWLFWGLVPLGRTNVNTPSDGSCEIITRHSFGDVLVSALTAGIITTHTIKVKDKRKSEKSMTNNAPATSVKTTVTTTTTTSN